MKLEKEAINRFMSKILKTDTCWLWQGSTSRGYGKISIKGRNISVHKISYELFKGPIPKGLDVCHTCDIKNCVNPKHLWLGTRQENMIDCVSKGRHNKPKGLNVNTCKLTEEQVREIRKKYIPRKYSTRKLANEYGLNQATIFSIISRESWQHI